VNGVRVGSQVAVPTLPTRGYGSSSVSSSEHHRIFTYDRDHIARAWSYRGSWGQRSSRDTKTSSTGTLSEVAGK